MSEPYRFDPEKKKEEPLDGKRIYASKAYVMKVDDGVYQFFKDVMVEEKDPTTGKIVREKTGRRVPWGGALREAKIGEPVAAHTFDHVTKTPISLTPIDESTREQMLASGFEVKREL